MLPAEGSSSSRPKPWLLHSLAVNTLNFCPFSMCLEVPEDQRRSDAIRPTPALSESILVAVPAPDDKKIDLHQFPTEKLAYRVPKLQPFDTGGCGCLHFRFHYSCRRYWSAFQLSPSSPQQPFSVLDVALDATFFEPCSHVRSLLLTIPQGMVMAIKLLHHPSNQQLLVIAGYEGGFAAVHLLDRASTLGSSCSRPTANTIPESARTIYLSQPHSQPIMSLDASPDGRTYFTSSADAIIAAHRIPEPLNIEPGDSPTAGNTAQGHVSTHTTSEVPITVPPSVESSVNKSPSEPLTFSKQVLPASQPVPKISSPNPPSLLSDALSSSTSPPKVTPPVDPLPTVTELQAPLKTVNTKHAGQQSLRVRSDGRILATGGWDSRIRVYSAKTLKEVATLKWHKEGVYAVGFGAVLDDGGPEMVSEEPSQDSGDVSIQANRGNSTLSKLQRQREENMQRKHWVAAGAKDGKVSLWEIY